MKISHKKWFLLPVLIAGLGLMLAGRVTAQTLTTLHNFTALAFPSGINKDGANPAGGLITNSSGNILYGTASGGGIAGNGTVFALNTDGTDFTNFYGGEGRPTAGLILSDNTLYGTTQQGGGKSLGMVFSVNTDGTYPSDLHSFTNSPDGGNPYAGLILSGNTLYGTTYYGGTSGFGMVFAVHTNGTGITNLHSFTATSGRYPDPSTNSDGAYPSAGLVLSGNTLYGTAYGGGGSGVGTVFAVHTDGTGFTNLHSFTAVSGSYPFANDDGARPYAGLVLSGNTLYGTAIQGGSSGNGTVFAVHTDGTGLTNLHSFTATSYSPRYGNSDGVNPYAGLMLSGNTLYGTALNGGGSGRGTVFALNTDGTGFTNLHSFTATACVGCPNSDGAYPMASLILLGNTLYGTANGGGTSGNGTVFSLSFTPQLTIIPSAANIVLSWPTNYAGFDYAGFTLQSTTNLASPLWNTNLPPPVVVKGQYTVTNSVFGTEQFFRLSQ